MNPWLLLLLSSLATFRLAELIAVDSGPFHLCKLLREATKGSHPWLYEMLTCFYCCSGWIALWLTLWLWFFDYIGRFDYVLWWAAIWGGAAVIYRAVRERTK